MSDILDELEERQPITSVEDLGDASARCADLRARYHGRLCLTLTTLATEAGWTIHHLRQECCTEIEKIGFATTHISLLILAIGCMLQSQECRKRLRNLFSRLREYHREHPTWETNAILAEYGITHLPLLFEDRPDEPVPYP